MSPSRLPATPFTRCALAFTVLLCLVFPFVLLGMGWIAKEFHQQHFGPRQMAAGATQVAAAQVAESPSFSAQESPPSESKSALIGSQIEEMVARSQQQSGDKNLSELEKMSKTLDSVSSDASVDDVTNSVQRWMGLSSRASTSKTATRMEDFDINSAQLHDVKRRGSGTGNGYTVVLIDAQGKTVEIELTEAEGREPFALMERIKANPFLEKIYRRVAMPLLDSLIQSAREQGTKPTNDTARSEAPGAAPSKNTRVGAR